VAEDRKSTKMNDEELLTLIASYERASMGSSSAAGATVTSVQGPQGTQMKTLEIDRFDALNMYYARPMGNEVENRSQIVIPELRDTIEWIMPQLMRIFAGSKNVCRFEAEGPNDVEQAQLETEVVNHIFMRENNGFFILHDYFKDALLLRNGYAKVYWEKEQKTAVESYTGLTQMELPQVLQEGENDKVAVLEQRESTVALPGQPPITVFDIKLRRTTHTGKVCVTCIPPEEVYVSPRAREGLNEDVPFVMHKTNRPRSDLKDDGYDAAWVDSLQGGKPNWLEIDALARNQLTDQTTVESPSDRSMQEIEVREVTMRVDYDGDGIAELRQILVAGDKVGDNEEIEEPAIASCSPVRMPHRHTGISYYDLIGDLQILKTTSMRQGLDGFAIANNLRIGVDWQNVNMDDLLTSRPGGVVRTKGPPSQSLFPIQQDSAIVSQVLPMMEYFDQMREMRTGVGRDTMGLDMDVLQDVTKGGQLAGMAAAGLKIELVARLLAEGVKDIFLKIHGALLRHQDQPLQYELAGKWVQVDPTTWSKRTRVTPVVGLGSGNRLEAQQNLAALTQMQSQLMQFGLIGPKQAYETYKMGAEILGFDSPERFAMDPQSPEFAQHQQQMQQMAQSAPPPPQVQAAQIRAQTATQQMQADNQSNVLKLKKELIQAQGEVISANARANAEMQHAAQENHQDRMVDVAGHVADIQGQKMDLVQTLVKAFAQILAAQLKQNAAADAGAMLTKDVKEASSLAS
jgi:hypothetical protein